MPKLRIRVQSMIFVEVKMTRHIVNLRVWVSSAPCELYIAVEWRVLHACGYSLKLKDFVS